MPPKLFSFTHFAKNASANPLVSHTFKTKDLKPFRFTHFQKKGGGYPLLSTLDPRGSFTSPTSCTLLCLLPTQARSARFPFPSGHGRRLFSWPLRSRWKGSRVLLRFEQASPATGRSGSSRRRSRDWRRGVRGNALRRRPRRRSSHIPSPGRSGKRRRRAWRRRTLRVSGGASWPVGT